MWMRVRVVVSGSGVWKRGSSFGLPGAFTGGFRRVQGDDVLDGIYLLNSTGDTTRLGQEPTQHHRVALLSDHQHIVGDLLSTPIRVTQPHARLAHNLCLLEFGAYLLLAVQAQGQQGEFQHLKEIPQSHFRRVLIFAVDGFQVLVQALHNQDHDDLPDQLLVPENSLQGSQVFSVGQ
jgi:hypothetical protein